MNDAIAAAIAGLVIPGAPNLSGYARLSGATFTGRAKGVTREAGDNGTDFATTAFVAAAVAAIVDSSPAALDTLNELAAALGDDPNFSTTITNLIAAKPSAADVAAAVAAAGGITGKRSGKSADYTVVAADNGKTIEVDATGGARTIALPDLDATKNGFTVTVIKTDSSGNSVTIDGNGSDTINGAATYALKARWEAAILKWTGTAWISIGGASTSWLRDFFGADSSLGFDTVGTHRAAWPYQSGTALVWIEGSGGGGSSAGVRNVNGAGGGGGGSGGGTGGRGRDHDGLTFRLRGAPGNASTGGAGYVGNSSTGGSGGDATTVTIGSSTYTAHGGGGGAGVSTAGIAESGAAVVGGHNHVRASGRTDAPALGGRRGGAGGVSTGTNSINGRPGGSGAVMVALHTSISKGDEIVVTIGAGGAGSSGRDGGQQGQGGRVTLVPLY